MIDPKKLLGLETPTVDAICEELRKEVVFAEANYPAFASAHEGYSIMLEEVDELWEHVKVKQKNRNVAEMRKEAVQVAAMAIRFIKDVCDSGKGNK